MKTGQVVLTREQEVKPLIPKMFLPVIALWRGSCALFRGAATAWRKCGIARRIFRRAVPPLFLLLLAFPALAVQPDEMLEDPVLEARAREIGDAIRPRHSCHCRTCEVRPVEGGVTAVHFNAMTTPSLRAAAVLAALLLATFVTACSNVPQDDRYQNRGRGGGWENFRAAVPTDARIT